MSVPSGAVFVDESESSQLLKLPCNDREPGSVANQLQHDNLQVQQIDMREISYAVGAFYATLQPVAITLVLSSLAVVYIKSPFSQQSADGGLSVYDISDGSESSIHDSNTIRLGKSMINAIVIVGAIAMMTFVMVFLYWARCIQCIQGYMIFSSFMLLCFMGGVFFFTVIDQFQIRLDWITFFFFLYNFSIVGVVSIFFQKGIPAMVTQGYLICTSILLVWQLSRFDEYTCFSLLVALAFYDLCAVLSPCGPLKALVGLMQERNVPLPGLLYEANLSDGYRRNNASEASSNCSEIGRSRKRSNSYLAVMSRNDWSRSNEQRLEEAPFSAESTPTTECRTPPEGPVTFTRVTNGIKRPAVLKLPGDLAHDCEEQTLNPMLRSERRGSWDGGGGGGGDTELGSREEEGVEMKCQSPQSEEIDVNYLSFSSSSSPFHVDPGHRVDSENSSIYDQRNLPGEEGCETESVGSSRTGTRSSVKLGLGDFVFYSMLVSRSATHGLPTFLATSFVVLGGLGVTLTFLAVHKNALPALPISILLGVGAYFLTRFFVAPFLDCLNQTPFSI